MSWREQQKMLLEKSDIDWELWRECLAVVPPAQPPSLPFFAGTVRGIKVMLVDGDKVKIEHEMDFVEAGNGYKWSWIPKDELWLDANLHAHDWPYNCYHESVEIPRMRDGEKYDTAHDFCNKVERELRIKFGKFPLKEMSATVWQQHHKSILEKVHDWGCEYK